MSYEDRDPAIRELMHLLGSYRHLPPHLQPISANVYYLAGDQVKMLPDGSELETGLRKLLEAKDCFVRAKVLAEEQSGPAPSDVWLSRDD